MNISKEELNSLIARAKGEKNILGKRKMYYCSAAAFGVYCMTFVIILIYGEGCESIITWPYVALMAILIGLYPVVNAVSKFAARVAGDKITRLINSVSHLVGNIRNRGSDDGMDWDESFNDGGPEPK